MHILESVFLLFNLHKVIRFQVIGKVKRREKKEICNLFMLACGSY